MMPALVQWQKLDSNDVCYPWFTHPMLEVIDKWDLRGKTVLEWGGGYSTIWWVSRGAFVHCVETSREWLGCIREELDGMGLGHMTQLDHVECNEGDNDQERRNRYINVRRGWNAEFPDIVVVDGILRYECMQEGIDLLSRNGGILIVDNYQQDGFICPACAELVKPYKGYIYRQEDHADHHGNPWQTAYWEIPA